MRRRTPHSTSFTAMLTKQVCSPAVAQTLNKLAVPQESVWYWVASRRRQYPLLCSAAEVTAMPLFHRVAVAAFTVGERGELLPSTTEQHDAVLHWRCETSSRGFTVASVGARGDQQTRLERKAASEAEARAQMLRYLLEHALYTPSGSGLSLGERTAPLTCNSVWRERRPDAAALHSGRAPVC